ncbi:MAG: tetratricopeptide repeat protein [Deltaproteobacteria bacterium]|nr:tetratricopeptide repeat protein [Deltaproteobacteria bacterium]
MLNQTIKPNVVENIIRRLIPPLCLCGMMMLLACQSKSNTNGETNGESVSESNVPSNPETPQKSKVTAKQTKQPIKTKAVTIPEQSVRQVEAPQGEMNMKAYLREGRQLAKEKKWEEAVDILRQADAQFPNQSVILGELGWALFNSNESVSEDIFLKAIKLEKNPKLKAAHLYNLGRIEEYYQAEDTALLHYQESLALRPNKTVAERIEVLKPRIQSIVNAKNAARSNDGGKWARYDMNSKKFQYQGQLIHPGCLSKLKNSPSLHAPKFVDFEDCQKNLEGVTVKNEKVRWDGVEAEYIAYDEYEILAYKGNHFLVNTISDWGGTDTFEDLWIVALEKDWLITVSTIDGGVLRVDPILRDGKIQYSYPVCAKDILNFDNVGKTLAVENCEDVECNSLCYLAEAEFEYNLRTGEKTFLAVRLKEAYSTDKADYGKEYRYQYCFNSLLNQVTKDGTTRLTPQKLAEFVTSFSKTCL